MAEQTSPLVSIIMPVFNGQNFIKESVSSVVHQTYANWELFIVNDGSTDNSGAIIKSFTDPRIFYLEQPNKGVGAARNLGLKQMRGDYFCFLDSDDVLPGNSIDSRLKVFAGSGSIQFVDGVVEIYDETLTELKRVRKASVKGPPFMELLHLNPGVFHGPTWMIKRAPGVTYAFREDMKYLEDMYFYFRVSSQGEFYYTEETILKYRTHDQSAMRKSLDGIALGYTQLVNAVLADFSEQLTQPDKWAWKLRVRKIMMLSFFGARQWTKGLKYLIFGKI